jgi:hypothetical protein
MNTLKLQYKMLCSLVTTIDGLLVTLQQKAYNDADLWLQHFKNRPAKQPSQQQLPTTNTQGLMTSLAECHQQTGRFLKAYLQEIHQITTKSWHEVYEQCYKKNIITYAEKGMLQVMKRDIPALCKQCNEKGESVVDIELVQDFNILSAIILRFHL